MKIEIKNIDETIEAGSTLNLLVDLNFCISVEKDFVYNRLAFHAYLRNCAFEYFEKLCKVKK